MARRKDGKGHEDSPESSKDKHDDQRHRPPRDRPTQGDTPITNPKKARKIQDWVEKQPRKYAPEAVAGSAKWSSRQSAAKSKKQRKSAPKITLSQRGHVDSDTEPRKERQKRRGQSDDDIEDREVEYKKKSKKRKAKARKTHERKSKEHKKHGSSGSGGPTVKISYSRSQTAESSDTDSSTDSSDDEDRGKRSREGSSGGIDIPVWLRLLWKVYRVTKTNRSRSKERENEKRRRRARHVSRGGQAKGH